MQHLKRLLALLVMFAFAPLAWAISAHAQVNEPACDPPVPALQPSVCVPLSYGAPPGSSTPAGVQGVDVSDYQGTVHWSEAKRAGVRWAVVQYGDGSSWRDRTFAANWRELRGLRLPHGAYLFLRPGDGSAEGRAFALAVDGAGLGERTLPPTLDAEVPGAYQQVCAAARAIRAVLHWHIVLVYTAPGLWPSSIGHCAAVLWVADYGVLVPALPWGFGSWAAWQWQVGYVAGIGQVDRDVATGILKLSYGRTVLLPSVQAQRHDLRVRRRRQHCHQALHGVKRLASHRAECQRELRKGSGLTRRARTLERS